MLTNWNLMFNVVLLIIVIMVIARIIRSKRQALVASNFEPSIGDVDDPIYDDIIKVCKVDRSSGQDQYKLEPARAVANTSVQPKNSAFTLVLFLLARNNRQLAGYDLFQTVLSAGLRFGEGQLFHRHQHKNGQGPVLCSLAAATATGAFDLQNIGALRLHGLCLFMEASGNPTIDEERFNVMLDTAKQLSEGLGAHLLDDQRQPISDVNLERYYQKIRSE